MLPSAAGLGIAATTVFEARLGTAAMAASGGGISAPIGAGGGAPASAGVDRRTLGRKRSPPLVLTMFGGGAD